MTQHYKITTEGRAEIKTGTESLDGDQRVSVQDETIIVRGVPEIITDGPAAISVEAVEPQAVDREGKDDN